MAIDWDLLHAQLRDGRGRVRPEDAAKAGLTQARRERLLQQGVLEQPAVRLLTLPAALDDSIAGRAQGYQLSILRTAVVSHWTALAVWGLWRRGPSVVWITVRGKWAPQREGLRVVASRSLPDADIVMREGLLVTSVARTLADMAGLVTTAVLRGLVLDARQRGLVSFAELHDLVRRRNGAKGIGQLRRILADLDVERPDSPLEHLIRRGLRETDLPPPHPEPLEIWTPRGIRQIDIPWPDVEVGIDCDGLAYHASREAHDEDALRRTAINLTEWRTVFATWYRAELGWAELIRDVSDAHELQRRRRRTSQGRAVPGFSAPRPRRNPGRPAA